MAPLVRRSWAPCGKTPILYQRTRSHEKISMIAALTVPPKNKRVGLYFSLHYANITARLVTRFLRNLSRQIQRPLVIVWDRFRPHKAVITQKFLRRNKKIHVFYLPAYAPELNPTEFFWSYLKNNPLANYPLHDLQTLSATARYHSTRIKRKPRLLRSFLYATPLFLCPK
jgi:transposase